MPVHSSSPRTRAVGGKRAVKAIKKGGTEKQNVESVTAVSLLRDVPGKAKQTEPWLDRAPISPRLCPRLGVAPAFDNRNASWPDSKAAKRNDQQAATGFCKSHKRVTTSTKNRLTV